MPNHVDNDFWVTGDLTSLLEFEEFAKEPMHDGESVLSANKFVPYPTAFKEADDAAAIEREKGNWAVKDGFNSGGYDWCLENWGTKWGIYDAVLVHKHAGVRKGSLKYRFNSAWSPPIPVILAMSKKYPSLKFTLKYYEGGMGFKGDFVAADGAVFVDEYYTNYRGHRGG